MEGDRFSTEPVAPAESFTISGKEYLVRFDGEKLQRVEKVNIAAKDHVAMVRYGAGRIVRSALPLELGDSMDALVAFYRFAMQQARMAPIFEVTPRTAAVLVLPSVFRDVVLYTFVSETERDTDLQLTDVPTRKRFSVTVPAERTSLVLIDRHTGRRRA
jgi:hypothetical protein